MRSYLLKLKKGKLPSKKVVDEYSRLRKLGFDKNIASPLSRARVKKRR